MEGNKNEDAARTQQKLAKKEAIDWYSENELQRWCRLCWQGKLSANINQAQQTCSNYMWRSSLEVNTYDQKQITFHLKNILFSTGN